MAEVITKTHRKIETVIEQCDVFSDVEYIEYAIEINGTIEISKVHFPYAIVLTQACDLRQDQNAKERLSLEGKGNQDKYLISVIVAPIYNFEDFLSGEHLSQLNMKMQSFPSRTKTNTVNLIQNENKRYHYLKFDESAPVVESIIDFKHYFTVSINYLLNSFSSKYVCSIDSMYRELILQRFSNFLSRIGLPDPE